MIKYMHERAKIPTDTKIKRSLYYALIIDFKTGNMHINTSCPQYLHCFVKLWRFDNDIY